MTKNVDVLAILNTFLMKVGLGRVLFDENNAVALTFDGITIMVQHHDAHQLLRVTSAIAKLQLEWESPHF